MSSPFRFPVSRRVLASLCLAGAATVLTGCVSTYGYRSGEGDYYYADPRVEYYGYGPYGSIGYAGDWYGSVTFRYGGYPYSTYPRYGYPYNYYGYGHGYGYPYYYGYRTPRPRPPGHGTPPPQYPPGVEPPPPGPPGGDDVGYDPRDLRDREGNDTPWRYISGRPRPRDEQPGPPPGNQNRGPVALQGSQPRTPPREMPRARPSAPPAPVAPVRSAPPRSAPPPRPVRSERPVRDVGHEP